MTDEKNIEQEEASTGASTEDDAPVEDGDLRVEPENEQDALAAERDSYRDTAMRLQADFENYRKRMVKQQTEAQDRAAESIVAKLLPVLDTIELAKAHEPNGSLEQVSSALWEVLSKEGLERIAAVEQPFDPEQHEAVAHEPGEGEPHVSEEMRAGYRFKGRVIRPAMVKVTG